MLNLGKDWGNYNLYNRNCSTLVKTVLKSAQVIVSPLF